ncbi:hypothetical protein [Geomicrobium sp. JCM 19039]|uniref:hypothetical protein n=1 Tax=Geomicrobium sp. JCM 19039 TaxID=1460636 RepID=UPI00045F1C9B|nr:hypothetical protein [Geomicrobium sp. JCM 19039]GAK13714.1 hypothetical protein JCM19039_3581 [Geomicrobium sp. JCM 19039]
MQRWYRPYHFYQHNPAYRNYPPADPTMLTESVQEIQLLLQQSQTLLHAFENQEFSYQVINAAQQGQDEHVDHLIHAIPGFTARTNVSYTPTGIAVQLFLPAQNPQSDCCTLSMELKWGN